MNTFTPEPGKIIVKPWEPKIDGVEIPDSFKQSDQIGEVVAVGEADVSLYHPEVKITTNVKIGDIIWHSPYLTEPFTYYKDNIRYRTIRFSEVNAILNG